MKHTQEQIERWVHTQIDTATDDMIMRNITITPASLATFFTKEYELPLNEEEAQEWLVQQAWWEPYKHTEKEER